VRLFAIFVRATTPSKSRDEISVREEGFDTPTTTVAVAMFKQ
jgi:hypothetical protein